MKKSRMINCHEEGQGGSGRVPWEAHVHGGSGAQSAKRCPESSGLAIAVVAQCGRKSCPLGRVFTRLSSKGLASARDLSSVPKSCRCMVEFWANWAYEPGSTAFGYTLGFSLHVSEIDNCTPVLLVSLKARRARTVCWGVWQSPKKRSVFYRFFCTHEQNDVCSVPSPIHVSPRPVGSGHQRARRVSRSARPAKELYPTSVGWPPT